MYNILYDHMRKLITSNLYDFHMQLYSHYGLTSLVREVYSLWAYNWYFSSCIDWYINKEKKQDKVKSVYNLLDLVREKKIVVYPDFATENLLLYATVGHIRNDSKVGRCANYFVH